MLIQRLLQGPSRYLKKRERPNELVPNRDVWVAPRNSELQSEHTTSSSTGHSERTGDGPELEREVGPCRDLEEDWDIRRSEINRDFKRYINNNIPIRLIQCDDTGNLRLVGRREVREYFQPQIDKLDFSYLISTMESELDEEQAEGDIVKAVKKIVKYAILSHRWSDDELSYQDFGRERPGGFEQSIGWTKIVRFCTEAARQGVCFAWIDTCCIDKTSSAELDESIRSMFKWYQNSTLCIIHLDQTTSLEDMAGDEWFRRGWTLQEILASGRVQFFNRNWHCIAPSPESDTGLVSFRKALEVVSQVTGIPVSDLRRFRPSPRDVDERMTWAANREVTREEDTAYCLMGIFDVSIPIAYGEGLDRAFCRLVEAIMAAGGDPSVLNWGGKPAKNHATACMPASPVSYQRHPKRNKLNSYRMDMTLTGKGLRLSLPVLSLNLGFPDRELSFSFISPPLKGASFSVTNLEYDRFHPLKGLGHSFALGITNYSLLNEKGNLSVVVHRPLIGWILKSSPFNGSESQHTETGRSWRRVSTATVHFSFADMPSRVVVDKRMLQIVYL